MISQRGSTTLQITTKLSDPIMIKSPESTNKSNSSSAPERIAGSPNGGYSKLYNDSESSRSYLEMSGTPNDVSPILSPEIVSPPSPFSAPAKQAEEKTPLMFELELNDSPRSAP